MRWPTETASASSAALGGARAASTNRFASSTRRWCSAARPRASRPGGARRAVSSSATPRGARHMDYAVRNTRVLARHVQRFLRGGGEAPQQLAEAIHELGLAVWALGAEIEASEPRADEVRAHASRAAALAGESYEADRSLGLAEIVAQVRSTAIDLVRAAEAAVSPDEPAGGAGHRGAAARAAPARATGSRPSRSGRAPRRRSSRRRSRGARRPRRARPTGRSG